MMYIGGPNEGKQLFLRDDQRFKQILAILEAAGRVDKWAIDFFLCEAIEPREYEIFSQDLPSKYAVGKRGVEILISALPDEVRE
jgi:hypothetical protein